MVHILLIDDTPDDRLLAIRELRRVFPALSVEEITEAQGLERLLSLGNFDLVITDYRLRWSDGIAVLRAVKAKSAEIPVVMFTNSGNEEVAVAAMKAGLDDYVIKSPQHFFRLPLAVRAVLEQAQQRQALKAAETRYSRLFDRVPVGLYQITPQGQILAANPALLQLLGYAEHQALPEVNAVDLHMELKVKRRWQEMMARDRVVRNLETPLQTVDGSTIWVRHNAKAIRNQQGEVLYYEGAVEDITDRKQVEEERKALLAREQAARAQAEAANRMKDEFLATLSHELRTPLNAVLGWANLLRSRQLNPATTARALETIERNARAQNQMIEDLLDISRVIRGKLRLTMSPTDLSLVVEAALEAVRPIAAAKTISLEKFYSPPATGLPEPSMIVSGDASRLQQVAWNLLTNAIKFTPVGGKVEVHLFVDQPQEASSCPAPFVCIQVKDTGQGISAEFLPYIFEYFRQADSSSTRSQGGLGLGLAIVRQLVEMHGGGVCADSLGIGQGATFTVRLPLLVEVNHQQTKDSQQELLLNAPLASSVPLASLASSAPTLQGLQVLLVDDEVDTREMLVTTLEFSGASVTAVDSVAAAKSAIALSLPDLLVSDIAMPEEDGYALINYLQTQGIQIPAVALTAYASESDRQTAIIAGFQRHLAKPVVPEQLIAVVAELVANRQEVKASPNPEC